jgi:hypothetical protein
MQQVILVSGNPIQGFTFTGPFESAAAARQYADENMQGMDWWTACLDAPE